MAYWSNRELSVAKECAIDIQERQEMETDS